MFDTISGSGSGHTVVPLVLAEPDAPSRLKRTLEHLRRRASKITLLALLPEDAALSERRLRQVVLVMAAAGLENPVEFRTCVGGTARLLAAVAAIGGHPDVLAPDPVIAELLVRDRDFVSPRV